MMWCHVSHRPWSSHRVRYEWPAQCACVGVCLSVINIWVQMRTVMKRFVCLLHFTIWRIQHVARRDFKATTKFLWKERLHFILWTSWTSSRFFRHNYELAKLIFQFIVLSANKSVVIFHGNIFRSLFLIVLINSLTSSISFHQSAAVDSHFP